MQLTNNVSLAKEAAEEAQTRVLQHIKDNKSFIMEAGAGAGKTYSLKQSLRYVITERGIQLGRNSQQVACITYTEAATEELRRDLDNNPAAWISTIHAFCWELLRDFQPALKEAILRLPKWNEKILEIGEIGNRTIAYDQGYRKYTDTMLYLHHDDIPALAALLLENAKFCTLLISRFPILFIDEYQDTNDILMESLKTNILNKDRGLLLGLFGDHWQRIYDNVCGEVVHDKLPVIKKHANFRSDLKIVDCLNRIRPELKQFANNEGSAESDVKVYLTNSWQGTRGTGAHKIGSLPDDVARQYFEATKNALEEDGWNLQPSSTKILLLTNSMLAREQGYEELLNCYPFPYTDQLLRKEDVYINFFAEVVEPASQAYRSKKYGAMFAALGKKARIRSHSDKLKWTKDMDELITLMETGSVGDVVDLLSKTKRPRLPERVSKREEELRNLIAIEATERTEDDQKKIDRLSRLRAVKYSQVSAIVKYIDGDTPFSTKHKVKGAEFENVLVVFSQGWSKYNFNKMLAWQTEDNVPETDKDQNFFEDNRNLFYVVCSRPKKRLALLFTHELDVDSVSTLQDWFGATSISEASLT